MCSIITAMVMNVERLILYIDVNNAFLSWTAVEKLNNGEDIDIRKTPAVIGGDEEKRSGIVLAKSPIAKEFGIKTGETLYMARKKCPNIKVYKGDFSVYRKYSNAMIEILKRYTDKIEMRSIDECAVDMTGFLKKDEDIIKKAKEISETIKNELKFTVNIGIAHNIMLAKMASDFEKPDKIHTLYENEIQEKMWNLPVSNLLMVGKKTEGKLKLIGINTIGDLAKRNQKDIIRRFGKLGKIIWEYANGIDNSEIKVEEYLPKGIGNSVTLPKDESSIENLNEVLLALCEQVAYRLRKQKMKTDTINVQIKTSKFQVYSHQKKINDVTDSTKIIFDEAKKLLYELYKASSNKNIRLLGLRIDTLAEEEEQQMTLFKENKIMDEKQKKVDQTMDYLKEKYGYDMITRAGKMHIGKMLRLKE